MLWSCRTVQSLGKILSFELGKWGHDRVCEVSRFLLHLFIIYFFFFFYVTKKKLNSICAVGFALADQKISKLEPTHHRLFWWRRSKLDTTTVQLFSPWLCVACVVRRESWDLSLEIVRIDCQKWNWTHILHATQEKYRWFIPAEPENFLGSHFLFFFSCHSHTFCSGTQFQVEFFNDKKKKKTWQLIIFF